MTDIRIEHLERNRLSDARKLVWNTCWDDRPVSVHMRCHRGSLARLVLRCSRGEEERHQFAIT